MKYINDLNLTNKVVLINVDFDADKEAKTIIDKKTLDIIETINYCINQKAKIVLLPSLNHHNLELDTVKLFVQCLSNKLDRNVYLSTKNYGQAIDFAMDKIADDDILVLEPINAHFDDEDFIEYWVKKSDTFICDSIDQLTRNNIAIQEIVKRINQVAIGFDIKKNLDVFSKLYQEQFSKPVITILANDPKCYSSEYLENILKISDKVLVAGKIAATFLKANHVATGSSYVNNDFYVDIEGIYNQNKAKFVLPIDFFCSKDNDNKMPTLLQNRIESNYSYLDIGKATFELFCNELKEAKTIIFDGILSTNQEAIAGTFQLLRYINTLDGINLIAFNNEINTVIHNLKYDNKYKLLSNNNQAFYEYLCNKPIKLLDLIEMK